MIISEANVVKFWMILVGVLAHQTVSDLLRGNWFYGVLFLGLVAASYLCGDSFFKERFDCSKEPQDDLERY